MVNQPVVDASMLLVSLLSSTAFCYFLFRHPDFRGKKTATFSMVFLAMNPFMNMWAHFTAIGVLTYLRLQKESFVYDFRFYSLLLMGAVFLLLSGYLLNRVAALSRGEAGVRRQLYVAGLIQLVFSAPLFSINPIGLMPGIASLLIFLVLALTKAPTVPKTSTLVRA